MQPWPLSNDIGQMTRPGFSLLGAGRWQFNQLQFGLRLTWERSGSGGRMEAQRRYDVRSDLFSGALAVAYRLSGRRLSLCVGLQAGVLGLYQRITLSATRVDAFNTASDSSSAGPLGGPVLEMDWALSRRFFLHLDAALPVGYLRVDDGETRRWAGTAYVQTTLGVGFYL
jgi:hypothetical protein